MNMVFPMNKAAKPRGGEGRFRQWLRRTLRRFRPDRLPHESWERGLSTVEKSAAQRRIAELIDSIAAKPAGEKESRTRKAPR
jgi:hypothetical protein